MVKPKIKRRCPVCGKVFYILSSRLKHAKAIYCSRECSYKGMKQNSRVDLECPVCGKHFTRIPSQIKSKYVFCSRECSYKGRSLGFVKRIVLKPYSCEHLRKRIRVECLICHKEFEVIPSKLKDEKRGKYCSRKCFEIAHKENMKGNRNPAWIDGRSYNYRDYRGPDWDECRKNAYRRDNYTCQECGVKCIGRKKLNEDNKHKLIQCHHINGNKENNSLDNLITLCVACHGKI